MTVNVAREKAIQEIPLEKLDVHRLNPRKDAGDVAELAASMRTSGVLEPLIAVKDNGGYAVVAGSRRLAAAKVAGLKTVPVLVREMSDDDVAAAALIENIQREDLSPLDEARAFRDWLQLTGKQQKELAERVGKHPSTIANALRLLEAPAPVQKALENGAITAAHARIALSVPAEFVGALDLKKGITTEDLEDQASEVKGIATTVAKVRQALDKAKADGHDVAWGSVDLWIGRTRTDIAKFLGPSPKKVAGIIAGYQDFGPPIYGMQGNVGTHDKACECRAYGPDPRGGRAELARVCVSPSGWKQYRQALAKTSRVRGTGAVKKRVISAAEKEKKRQRAFKVDTQRAKRALEGLEMGYRKLNLKPDARILKGGLEGEAARLILFGIVSERSAQLMNGTWRLQLWNEITKIPLKDVRERTLRWAVALGQREISDETKCRRELQAAVNEHYKAGRTR